MKPTITQEKKTPTEQTFKERSSTRRRKERKKEKTERKNTK